MFNWLTPMEAIMIFATIGAIFWAIDRATDNHDDFIE